MKRTSHHFVMAILTVAMISGCADRQTTPAASESSTNEVQPTQPAPVQPEPQQPASSETSASRIDPILQEDLKAGLDAMTPRIVATVDAYQKVAPREDMRFDMHPDAEKNAVIEFDVAGLNSLTLSPYMGDFSSIPDCAGSSEAGIARVRWTLDGGTPNELSVDRNYSGTIVVQIGGAKRLKIEVDKGNAVHWCDWLGLGIARVE